MVCHDDFEFAFDKQTIGVDLKSRVRDMEDLKITAYHEAGHTLVSYYTKDSNPIHKVTIVSKGQTGGHTAFIPKENQWHQTRSQLLAMMDVGMGGRAAEAQAECEEHTSSPSQERHAAPPRCGGCRLQGSGAS